MVDGVEGAAHDEKHDFSFAAYADDFDRHIGSSIRGYDNLREDCVALSRSSRPEGLHRSRHRLFQRGVSEVGEGPQPEALRLGRLRRTDVEGEFKDQWFSRRARNVKFKKADARTYDGYENLSLVFSLFTLQFLPESDRLPLVTKIYESLNEGGAFSSRRRCTPRTPRSRRC